MIKLSDIRRDGGTQSRAAINEETVADYADAMADPDTVFPPCIVYYDGKAYWLADGFHRVAAWERVGRVEVPAEIRQGDRRAAILHSCGANAAHGLRRTNDDKRRAVMTLLEDEEWSKWSDREIARRVRVHHNTVGRMRLEVTGEISSEPRTYTTKHGTEAQMNTANIGKHEHVEQPGAEEQGQPAVSGEVASNQQNSADEREDDAAYQPGEVGRQPDQQAEARKGLSGLTREGLEDEVIGLREENTDLRKRVKDQSSEITALKAQVKELTSGEDAGRKIGKLQREVVSVKHARDEALAAAKRMEYRLKKTEAERDNAIASLQSQEIALG